MPPELAPPPATHGHRPPERQPLASAASASRWVRLAASAILGVATVSVGVFVAHRAAFQPVRESQDVRTAARGVQLRVLELRSTLLTAARSGEGASADVTAARRRLGDALDSLHERVRPGTQAAALADTILGDVATWDAAIRLEPADAADPERLAAFGAARAAVARLVASETDRQERWLQRVALVDTVGVALVLASLLTLAGLLMHMARRLARETTVVTEQHAILARQRDDLALRGLDLQAARAELTEAVADTDRARAVAQEQERQRQEVVALMDAAIDSAPVGFAFFDRELKFVRANAFVGALLGRRASELPGVSLSAVASQANQRALDVSLRRVLSGGTPVVNQRMATDAASPTGARDLIVSFYPVHGPMGGVAGVACIAIDVTDRVVLEEQLRQAQKLEAVGRLAGGVAHDFNNLLTVARTYCDLLLDEFPAHDPKRSDLAEIRAATDRAAVLSRRLLAFGRKQMFAPKRLSLNDVVDSLQLMLTRTLPESVTLDVRLAESLDPVVADAGHVEQVVMNLVINAVDAMPEGGPVVISTSMHDSRTPGAGDAADAPPGRYVRLAVADTGIGMDATTRAQVFEPFFTTKAPGKGTGLGLSTVYGIVEQHGGTIRIDSEPGRGTTFAVYLPVAPDEPRVAEREAAAPQRLPRGSGVTVLVVDDEPPVVVSLHRMLSAKGYSVLGASSGTDAIGRLGDHPGPVHVVLADVMMPGMDVETFLDRVAEARPDASIVMMSGYAEDRHRRVIEARRLPFVAKPFATETLLAALDEVLSKRSGRYGAGAPA